MVNSMLETNLLPAILGSLCVLLNLLKPSGFFTYRTARFNIQNFYMVLALRRVFCADLRTDSDLCFMGH
jgi:hypothetical protein